MDIIEQLVTKEVYKHQRKIAHKHQIKCIIWIILIAAFVWKCYDVTTSYNAFEKEEQQKFLAKQRSDEKWVEINKITANMRAKMAEMDKQERLSGKVDITETKNDFGGLATTVNTIRPIDETQSEFNYIVDADTNHGIFKISAKGAPFVNIIVSKPVQFEFDGVVKTYSMYLCNYDLCVFSNADFADDLKKSSTMRIAIPYDAGKSIATFNVTQLKGLLK